MESFELMSSDHFHVILHPDKEHGLIFNRLDGAITTIYYNDAKELSNLKAIGEIYGIVGRFLDKYLILIKSQSKIGSLYEPNSKTEHDVFVINQVQYINISHKSAVSSDQKSTPTDTNTNSILSKDSYYAPTDTSLVVKFDDEYSMEALKKDEDHDAFSSLPVTFSTNNFNSSQVRAVNWNPFNKLANSLKSTQSQQQTTISESSKVSTTSGRNNANQDNNCNITTSQIQGSSLQDDADKRLLDETMKLFNKTNSFYYSPTLDLTRRFSSHASVKQSGDEATWRTADERFFWNKFMLKDLIELSKQDSDANFFICVILQGFISIELHIRDPDPFNPNLANESNSSGRTTTSVIKYSTGRSNDNDNERLTMVDNYDQQDKLPTKTYQLALVSRRSVFQAGTRYRRRGCDEAGNCANFVETEQIFRCKQHFTSLVIIRGSIPLYWYQSGYNYRPPPMLTRSEEDNHKAFNNHFQELFRSYKTEQIIAVDCTEHTGREKVLHDAYKNHLEKLQAFYPKLRLIEFDFHKYCHGRQCTDLQIEKNLRNCGLTDALLKDVRLYWNDGDVIWNQEGVFRVNCLDCSDRTNVVQRAIALKILDLQLARLGIIGPDACPEENAFRKIMQVMWSTNGNVLSTQYCGTRALFGGGERKLSGYLKDTYSSASRYYISKFRDVYRQAAIDAMLGIESDDRKNLVNSTNLKEQYELLQFDPIIAGRSGKAMLKDVGNKFSDRLARLRGKFHGRPYMEDISNSNSRTRLRLPVDVSETRLSESLGEMTIDWPTTEEIDSCSIAIDDLQQQEQQRHQPQPQDVFARFTTNCEDSFQDDDEFGQLMLSIDLADLHEEEGDELDGEEKPKNDEEQVSSNGTEEIGLTEARGVINKSTTDSTGKNQYQVDTTST